MTSPLRFALLPALLPALLLASGAALAAATSTPFNVQPDPALQTASRADIEGRFRRTCAATQAQRQGGETSRFTRPCGCYASRTLRSLDAAELASYRGTGVFNDTARVKALAALDACRLPRPV